MRKWFSYWQWLKDASGAWSFARVVGFGSITANLIWRFYMGIDGINNVWQAVVGCCGLITGLGLWLIELFRENKRVTVDLAGKKYTAELGDDGKN